MSRNLCRLSFLLILRPIAYYYKLPHIQWVTHAVGKMISLQFVLVENGETRSKYSVLNFFLFRSVASQP